MLWSLTGFGFEFHDRFLPGSFISRVNRERTDRAESPRFSLSLPWFRIRNWGFLIVESEESRCLFCQG